MLLVVVFVWFFGLFALCICPQIGRVHELLFVFGFVVPPRLLIFRWFFCVLSGVCVVTGRLSLSSSPFSETSAPCSLSFLGLLCGLSSLVVTLRSGR